MDPARNFLKKVSGLQKLFGEIDKNECVSKLGQYPKTVLSRNLARKRTILEHSPPKTLPSGKYLPLFRKVLGFQGLLSRSPWRGSGQRPDLFNSFSSDLPEPAEADRTG
ncbi:MAG: hypothetical protein IJX76_00855 [Clostridia bacterium]|nr:hypothetical protein [Clostridia bacterium]